MTITLHYHYKEEPEKIFSSSNNEIIIGRPQSNPVDVDLSPDIKVSRPHAKLFYELGTWWIKDLNSRYGTWLNGERLTEPTSLSPGDRLQLGETEIRVDFLMAETDSELGTVTDQFTVSESLLPEDITEDKRLEVLARISQIAAYSKSQQAKLEAFLGVLADAFPESGRKTILLVEGRDLVPRASWPPGQSHISFTLVRQAIRSQQALHWVQEMVAKEGSPIAASLHDTIEAIYAPMLSNGQVIGVIQVDSPSSGTSFSKKDLDLLSVIANIIGAAIKASGTNDLPKLPSVFLSYAHEDRSFVNRLAADLRRRGIKIYLDERLRSGEGWRKQLAIAIENTDAFVLVMSPSSVTSQYVEWELDTAQALNKKIYPLMNEHSDLPKSIISLHYLRIDESYENGIDELTQQLYELINPSFESYSDDVLERIRNSQLSLTSSEGQTRGHQIVYSTASYTPPPPQRNILHLSDLHFGTEEDAHNWYGILAEDLRLELKCTHVDALVISGDVANFSTEKEYTAAKLFLDKVCKEFQVEQSQVVITPGNHDLNWKLSKKAYRPIWRDEYQGPPLSDGNYIDIDDNTMAIRDEDQYKLRFEYFSNFYKSVKGEPYPLEYEKQYSLHHFPGLNLIVLALNSAWRLDHRYKSRAGINPSAITNALAEMRQIQDNEKRIKIAVWHHPIQSAFEDRITDTGFMQRLAVSGFRVALHGHIHKAETSLFRYDVSPEGRKLDIVCAGTFGAPVKEWVPGYPLEYNLLKLQGDKIIVETRHRAELNGSWKPYAVWTQGPGKDPLPRYEINL